MRTSQSRRSFILPPGRDGSNCRGISDLLKRASFHFYAVAQPLEVAQHLTKQGGPTVSFRKFGCSITASFDRRPMAAEEAHHGMLCAVIEKQCSA